MMGFRDLGAMLGVHWRTVRRWWRAGMLNECEPVRMRSGKVMLNGEKVLEWFKKTQSTEART